MLEIKPESVKVFRCDGKLKIAEYVTLMQKLHVSASEAVGKNGSFSYGGINGARAVLHYLCLAEAFHTALVSQRQNLEYPGFLKWLANVT